MKAVLQSEVAECGLACIAMVAKSHGMEISLRELRSRFQLSLKGVRLGQLIRMAEALGFQTRPLRLEIEDLGKLTAPCILHFDLNHFVVLEKVERARVMVLDPASGAVRLSMGEVSSRFTGVALEMSPTADFRVRPATPSVTMGQLIGPVSGFWPAVAQILAFSSLLQLLVVIAPFLMQWVVDHVLVAGDRDLLNVLVIGFGLALLLQAGAGWLRGWSIVRLSSSVGIRWMDSVSAHLLRLPLVYFERRHLGDVMSRLESVRAIQRILTAGFIESIVDGMMVVAALALMLTYSWKLCMLSLLAVGVYLGLRVLAYGSMHHRTERHLVAEARRDSHLLESLRGIQSIKVAGDEARRASHFSHLVKQSVNQEAWLARQQLSFSCGCQVVFGLERIGVIWVGAKLALDSVFSVGMLVAYLAYREQFSQRIVGLIDRWMEFRMLRLHGERLADIVLTTPDCPSRPYDPPTRGNRIEVENLGFSYASGEPWVLEGCSFSVQEGESVAIIGPSGCGKSTLAKLLLGLLTPSMGRVRVAELRSGKAGNSSAHATVGAVMQDDQLFSGTIADNISFFDPGHDAERIESAAQEAAIHDEILKMPMGFNSLGGDMGSSLSGGQKQRILLARALYRRPELLILDEATSHLDTVSERQVNANIRQLRLTKVIVAHRPETIVSADRVLVMENGRIVREWRPPTEATR